MRRRRGPRAAVGLILWRCPAVGGGCGRRCGGGLVRAPTRRPANVLRPGALAVLTPRDARHALDGRGGVRRRPLFWLRLGSVGAVGSPPPPPAHPATELSEVIPLRRLGQEAACLGAFFASAKQAPALDTHSSRRQRCARGRVTRGGQSRHLAISPAGPRGDPGAADRRGACDQCSPPSRRACCVLTRSTPLAPPRAFAEPPSAGTEGKRRLLGIQPPSAGLRLSSFRLLLLEEA